MIDVHRAAKIIAPLFMFLVSVTTPASGRVIEGVYFAPRIIVSDLPMELNGVGLKTVWRLYKVSAAALYLAPDVDPRDVLGGVPKRLEIEYFHPIAARDFVNLTDKLLRDNVDHALLAGLQSRIDRFNALYRDVKPGDRYALTYMPAKGTVLELNGVELGVIEGEDFASAVFSMWFGPRPLSRSLKLELLGRA